MSRHVAVTTAYLDADTRRAVERAGEEVARSDHREGDPRYPREAVEHAEYVLQRWLDDCARARRRHVALPRRPTLDDLIPH